MSGPTILFTMKYIALGTDGMGYYNLRPISNIADVPCCIEKKKALPQYHISVSLKGWIGVNNMSPLFIYGDMTIQAIFDEAGQMVYFAQEEAPARQSFLDGYRRAFDLYQATGETIFRI